jgi:zinc/manganese transport system ATP-binding protein/zinc transport system ATP-binding protein
MLHPFPHEVDETGPIVELQGVTCGYGSTPALTEVDLTIMAGDFVGLVGPSGAGKTTLLRAILGAVGVYRGQIKVNGRPINRGRPRAGYVPQLETIDWNFPVTVEQVVLMGCASDGWLPWHRRVDVERARAVMERLGIAGLARRHIRALSGGQQQRTFLGRALVSNPELLLLDEPTSGVDIKTRDDILHLLDELNHEGATVIMTTHELNAVAAHLPWVVCINGGVIAQGPPSEVYTPDVLKRTYGAEMAVVEYQGMTLVAETPHHIGRNGRNNLSRHRAKARVGEMR